MYSYEALEFSKSKNVQYEDFPYLQKMVNQQTLTPNNNANFEQSKDQLYENITSWAILKFISVHKYF